LSHDISTGQAALDLAYDSHLLGSASALVWGGSSVPPTISGSARAGLLGLAQRWNC
jgi:hypothetical protein